MSDVTTIGVCVTAYLGIGAVFAIGYRDLPSILLWPFGLDIRLHHHLELRRIDRVSKRKLTEVIRERDASLRLVSLERTGTGSEMIITVDHGGEISRWRGTCTIWNRVPDGDRASSWLEKWLCDRWTAARWEQP